VVEYGRRPERSPCLPCSYWFLVYSIYSRRVAAEGACSDPVAPGAGSPAVHALGADRGGDRPSNSASKCCVGPAPSEEALWRGWTNYYSAPRAHARWLYLRLHPRREFAIEAYMTPDPIRRESRPSAGRAQAIEELHQDDLDRAFSSQIAQLTTSRLARWQPAHPPFISGLTSVAQGVYANDEGLHSSTANAVLGE